MLSSCHDPRPRTHEQTQPQPLRQRHSIRAHQQGDEWPVTKTKGLLARQRESRGASTEHTGHPTGHSSPVRHGGAGWATSRRRPKSANRARSRSRRLRCLALCPSVELILNQAVVDNAQPKQGEHEKKIPFSSECPAFGDFGSGRPSCSSNKGIDAQVMEQPPLMLWSPEALPSHR